ncbi:MAG: YdcF family protein [Cytophagales bacterium]|jgi:SanA protein|nr:YdcF family protein [Cytophagales bacterium]
MRYLKAAFWLFLLAVLSVAACNFWVARKTKPYVYASLDSLPACPTGLVLGTSRRVRNGSENLFFKHRIEAATRLYQLGKVKHLILSGDNSSRYYNEPADMKSALLQRGVPETAMTLDYAGQNTLQSVVRCHALYNQDSVVVISQAFHGSRAVFIARHYRFPFVAYAAEDVPWQESLSVRLREWLARPKAMLDIYVLYRDETVFAEEHE